MPTFPVFGAGTQSKSTKVTAQRRVNCYYEFQPEGDAHKVAIYGTPGLALFTSFGDEPIRGMYVVGDLLYVVHRGTLWEVNNAGAKTSRGTLLTTTGSVYMADNGEQLMIVDGQNGYIWDYLLVSFSTITDPDFITDPASVTFLDGYFIVNDTTLGQFYLSALYDGDLWNALDFATAESSPDKLVRVFADRNELILFGERTTEYWADTGAADFPFGRMAGGTLEWGLAARDSVAKYQDSIACLARNRMGEVIVAQMVGYDFRPISTPELAHEINSYTAVENAVGFAWMLGQHPMYQITFPSASDEGKTWLYDGATQIWSELKSKNISRHRTHKYSYFLNKNIVSDYENGNLYRYDTSVYTDNGDEIALELISRHIFENNQRFVLHELDIVNEPGVGLSSGQGSDPQMMLQTSRDGGFTYGNEMWADMGKIGEYRNRAVWRRLGTARDMVFKIRITDPVKRVIVSAGIKAEPAGS